MEIAIRSRFRQVLSWSHRRVARMAAVSRRVESMSLFTLPDIMVRAGWMATSKSPAYSPLPVAFIRFRIR